MPEIAHDRPARQDGQSRAHGDERRGTARAPGCKPIHQQAHPQPCQEADDRGQEHGDPHVSAVRVALDGGRREVQGKGHQAQQEDGETPLPNQRDHRGQAAEQRERAARVAPAKGMRQHVAGMGRPEPGEQFPRRAQRREVVLPPPPRQFQAGSTLVCGGEQEVSAKTGDQHQTTGGPGDPGAKSASRAC